jgi:glycosyltransferase involved in cell wall biosynthesis
MEVHQVLVSVAYGDAVTNEALRLRTLLRRFGRSEIFAQYIDLRVPGVRPLKSLEESVPGHQRAAFLVHYSIGHPELQRLLMAQRRPLVIRYHNITPGAFFESYDPQFARMLDQGRELLAQLADRTARAIGVSGFNAEELQQMGFAPVSVVPLVVDPARLTGIAAERLPVAVPEAGRGPVILFVGRISPNKAHHELIQAFHVLKTYLKPDAHLVLAGSFYQPQYFATLKRYVAELALPGVVFTDQVTDAALAAVYRRADVFVCLSEHEGFGMPLLEAMAFRVPVVAYAATAIPETVDDAALLLPRPDPLLVAEAVYRVLGDRSLRSMLIERGSARIKRFDTEAIGNRLLNEVMAAVA